MEEALNNIGQEEEVKFEIRIGALRQRPDIADELDRPATSIERNQRSSNQHRTNVQLTPFTREYAANHQRAETQHNPGNDVACQNDKHSA